MIIVAIIPARGGSKGIHRKNVKWIAGKPLIAWSIEQAKKSKYIDLVYVTTEDEEIKGIAKSYGAMVIDRPPEMSTDEVSSIPAIQHALREIRFADYYVLLQPTSPIRREGLIDDCIEQMLDNEADCIITCKNNYKLTIGMDIRRQDIDKWKEWDGSVYVGSPSIVLWNNSLYDGYIETYMNSQDGSLEIDTPFDFWLVEKVLEEYDYENLRS